MPIVFEKSHSFYSMLLWRSDESIEELSALSGLTKDQLAEVGNFKSENRRREYLSVRAALRNMLGDDCPQIRYDALGKPSLSNGDQLSISHTGNLIALMHSKTHNVGIDIEALRDKILSISKKFVNERENQNLPAENVIEHLHAIWCAKEVVYKIYGKKEVDFRKELMVHAFDLNDNRLKTTITKPDFNCTISVHFFVIDQAMLGWGFLEQTQK